MEIFTVPILNDNYAYVIQTLDRVAVIDPGEAKPIVKFMKHHGFDLNWIINTHHHGDHTGGNLELQEAFPDCKVAAPAECGTTDCLLKDGEKFTFGDITLEVIETVGHTKGHVILFEPNHKILFSGDTLFAMGCGRLFEGNAEDMFEAMKKIKSLPGDTKIYCGHEYTASNAKFVSHLMPDNDAIQQRMKTVMHQPCTMPTLLDQELKTNPFLMASTVEEFAQYRNAKDNF